MRTTEGRVRKGKGVRAGGEVGARAAAGEGVARDIVVV